MKDGKQNLHYLENDLFLWKKLEQMISFKNLELVKSNQFFLSHNFTQKDAKPW